jgi:hypothetical protein
VTAGFRYSAASVADVSLSYGFIFSA